MKALIPAMICCLLLVAACNSGKDDSYSEESLGLRSSSLYDEDASIGEMPVYSTSAPGSGTLLDRSFENAPPLIPHTVEGFLPIKATLNMCLTCHMPNVAAATKSTPIPVSHFVKYRPEVTVENGIANVDRGNDVVVKDLEGLLYQGRYNCTQCHVPQAQVDPVVENSFQAVYRTEKARSRSNLAENIGEGVR